MAQSTIWTTEKINGILDKLRFGEEIDNSCFYERNFELKGQNIFFQLTPEEEQEFVKCSQDIEYFVETYCRFLTDEGRKTVTLRESQRDILNTIGKEVWVEKIKDFGPSVRNFILMSARQAGKCFLFDTQIVIKNTSTNGLSKITIGELYNLVNKQLKKTKKQKIIFKIKTFLYKLYIKMA